MKKKLLRICIVFLAAYTVLLCLLILCEGSEGSFKSPGDAIWYTLATMTTVGYGDVAPVTAPGRIIGTIFMLLSYGMLAFIISFVLDSLRGQILPRIRLWKIRSKPWNVFTDTNPVSIRLAENFPQDTVVFLTGSASTGHGLPGTAVCFSDGQVAALAQKEPTFFVFGEDTLVNRRRSELLKQYGKVYCCSDLPCGQHDPAIDYFCPSVFCSRQYWQTHPQTPGDSRYVLIGGGRCLSEILQQALLVNLISESQSLCYHIYGDSRSFREDHYRLQDFMAVDCTIPGRDSVFFHTDAMDPEILLHADRIILCCDSDRENLELLARIRAGYPSSAAVDIRLTEFMTGLDAQVFGHAESLFSRENVLHHRLDRIAMELNDRYNRQNPKQAVPWNELSAYMRNSNLAAADHQLVKIRILLDDFSITEETPELLQKARAAYCEKAAAMQEPFRRIEHARWCRYLYMNNWSCGPVKCDAARVHPLLRDYDELSAADKAKNDNAWAVIGC